jgi:hypothetical protein
MYLIELNLGASVLSEPLRFTLDDGISSHSTGTGSIMGGIFAAILAIIALVVVAAFLFMKSKKLKNKNANGGVAFENPSYLRETNVEQVHVRKNFFPPQFSLIAQ